ncbi:unnamed protein product, partial [Rotaria socialis]
MYDDDCFDYYANQDITEYTLTIEQSYRMEHQIISFCRRHHFQEKPLEIDPHISALTFYDLHQKNVTSAQLYSWSAHIDLIEEYEAFRQNFSDHRITGSSMMFYNCSSKNKFGRFCQSSFDSKNSFNRIVKEVLIKAHSVSSSTTCFLHLNCTHDELSWCLDWREICDGKFDCWPIPVDEQNCEQLEENECGPNEYRCFNGQCIPEIFLADNVFTPDCIDRTDKDFFQATQYSQNCKKGDPAFRCTEITHSHWVTSGQYCCEFSCGFDSCRAYVLEAFERGLLSYSANTHLTQKCWATMICLVQVTQRISFNDDSYTHLFNGICENVCSEQHQPCRAKMIEHCPPLFEFPAKALGWHQLHFVYSWNRTNGSTMPHSPDYICYNEEDCSISQPVTKFRALSKPSVILACELPDVQKSRINWVLEAAFFRRQLNMQCSLKTNRKDNYCSGANQFQCSKKCISTYRLMNRQVDCLHRIDGSFSESCNLGHKHCLTCSLNISGMLITNCIPIINAPVGPYAMCGSKARLPHFPTLCDGYNDYSETIDGIFETDETNCERWP